jgi:hypothetical protein
VVAVNAEMEAVNVEVEPVNVDVEPGRGGSYK